MLGDPLHPAIVHFPIVLALLLPFFAGTAMVFIHRGTRPHRAWAVVALVGGMLFASSWVSVATGERDEEVVEGIVPESSLEIHEETGELFMVLAGANALLLLGGLINGNIGAGVRAIASLGTLVLVVMAFRVGHSGGQLVYTHGAARAYAGTSATEGDAAPDRRGPDHERHDEGEND